MNPKKVLIVDDALIMRARIKSIAAEAGWEVCGEATNGEEAVVQCAELQPDLVTLDIVMPIMDGVEALRKIISTNPSTHVVMVTAVDQREKLSECIEIGAMDFIVKPFDSDVLRDFFDKCKLA